jgi:uncharacterized protein (TIGR03000 family)
MLRRNVLKFVLASIGAIGIASVNTTDASAGFHHRHHGSSGGSSGGWGSSGGSSGGYYGSYGSSGGSYGGGWGSSGGSSGGSYGGGWFGHHHRRWYGGYGSSGGWGSSGGSSGGYAMGSSGGSSGGWGSSGGSSGGSYGGGWSTMSYPPATIGTPSTVPMDPNAVPTITPMPNAPAPAPAPAPAAPAPTTGASLRSAILNVAVPADAKVFVNGLPTTSTGVNRRYVSNNLEPGYNYTYELKVELIRDGKTLSETKIVKVRAGDSADLAFDFNNASEEKIAKEPAKTSVTLLVPDDAQVYLSGNPTRSFGPVREFSTTKLEAGNIWNNYVVRVEVQRDGRTLSKEQTITLQAGENRELKFDFDVEKVASAR